MLSIQFTSGALGPLDMTWCAPPDHARPEWALNETVIEGTTGIVRVMARRHRSNGPASTAKREQSAGRLAGPTDRVYVDGYRATQEHFIDGPIARLSRTRPAVPRP